jgi:hypothetical protein
MHQQVIPGVMTTMTPTMSSNVTASGPLQTVVPSTGVASGVNMVLTAPLQGSVTNAAPILTPPTTNLQQQTKKIKKKPPTILKSVSQPPSLSPISSASFTATSPSNPTVSHTSPQPTPVAQRNAVAAPATPQPQTLNSYPPQQVDAMIRQTLNG